MVCKVFFSFWLFSKSWLISKLRIFSPQNFSAAGPFKASLSGDSDLRSHSSPPLTLSLENGPSSQPIRTPARVKKVKGHHRWRENGREVSHHCMFILFTKCWYIGFCFSLRFFAPPRGVKKQSTDRSLHRIGTWFWSLYSIKLPYIYASVTTALNNKEKNLAKPGIDHL